MYWSMFFQAFRYHTAYTLSFSHLVSFKSTIYVTVVCCFVDAPSFTIIYFYELMKVVLRLSSQGIISGVA